MTSLRFKKLDERATLPTRGSELAAGLDLYSIEKVTIKSKERCAVRTGLSVSIPCGLYGRIAPRSGLALKSGIDILAGVIDSDYRGEILCILVNLGQDDFHIEIGNRIAQLIVEQVVLLAPVWDSNLEDTDRSTSGFGSTGQ